MPENNIHIRQITSEEIHTIEDLARQIWPVAFEQILSKLQIEYMMNMMYSHDALVNDIKKGIMFFILQYHDENAGYAAIEKINNDTYKLHKIYLAQKYHGKGMGKEFIHHLENLVKDLGASYLKLNVNRNNKAVYFYKRCGYDIIYSEDIDIGHNFYMNDYVMQKKLM